MGKMVSNKTYILVLADKSAIIHKAAIILMINEPESFRMLTLSIIAYTAVQSP